MDTSLLQSGARYNEHNPSCVQMYGMCVNCASCGYAAVKRCFEMFPKCSQLACHLQLDKTFVSLLRLHESHVCMNFILYCMYTHVHIVSTVLHVFNGYRCKICGTVRTCKYRDQTISNIRCLEYSAIVPWVGPLKSLYAYRFSWSSAVLHPRL